MSDPVFDKMQHLMDKYQGAGSAQAVSPAEPPILTDVVRLGDTIRADQLARLDELPEHDIAHQALVTRIMQDVELRLLREFDTLITSQIADTVTLVLADAMPILHDRLRELIRASIEDAIGRPE